MTWSPDRQPKRKSLLSGATILFDLDGTAVDTAPDLVAAANATLESNGFMPVETRIIQPAVGIGARAMMDAALREQGYEPQDAELARLTEAFIAYYAEHICVHSRAFPGLTDVLDELAALGATLAVCTNKREALARKLLDALGIADRFKAIVGRDTVARPKPDPLHILETLRLAGGDRSLAVMIGDSSADSHAAKGAAIPFIAVSFGYGESPVEVLEPDAIIHSFAELIPALERMFAAP